MGKSSNWGQSFIDLAAKKGLQLKKPTQSQFNRFINYLLIGKDHKNHKVVSVCLKKVKSTNKNNWVWVEIKNKKGDPGWIFGDADFIVFEFQDKFLFIPRKTLLDYVYKNVDFDSPISSNSWDAKYKIYQRHGFLDQITQLKISKIQDLPNSYVWTK